MSNVLALHRRFRVRRLQTIVIVGFVIASALNLRFYVHVYLQKMKARRIIREPFS